MSKKMTRTKNGLVIDQYKNFFDIDKDIRVIISRKIKYLIIDATDAFQGVKTDGFEIWETVDEGITGNVLYETFDTVDKAIKYIKEKESIDTISYFVYDENYVNSKAKYDQLAEVINILETTKGWEPFAWGIAGEAAMDWLKELTHLNKDICAGWSESAIHIAAAAIQTILI